MNTVRIMTELGRLDEVIRLVQDAERLATRPEERWRLVSELVTVEARLERLQHRMLESVLVEVLWHYEAAASGKAGEAARMLLAQLAARKED